MDKKDELKAEHGNRYDWRDIVRRESVIIAGPMKMASYRVRDPDTGEFSSLQFHLTYNNTVMAVMGEEAAKLFANFVLKLSESETAHAAA